MYHLPKNLYRVFAKRDEAINARVEIVDIRAPQNYLEKKIKLRYQGAKVSIIVLIIDAGDSVTQSCAKLIALANSCLYSSSITRSPSLLP